MDRIIQNLDILISIEDNKRNRHVRNASTLKMVLKLINLTCVDKRARILKQKLRSWCIVETGS